MIQTKITREKIYSTITSFKKFLDNISVRNRVGNKIDAEKLEIYKKLPTILQTSKQTTLKK